MKIKIFCTYFQAFPIFKSEIIEPIQAGSENSKFDLGILKDNTGENISHRNFNYGELTVLYWVWKNYLKTFPDDGYIGFCHYRRFMNLDKKPVFKTFNCIEQKKFINFFKKSTQIKTDISAYDIILPMRHKMKKSLKEMYIEQHSTPEELELFKNILCDKYPQYIPYIAPALNRKAGYHCLTFLMRKNLLEDFCEWSFDLLFETEKRSDWTTYTSYEKRRTPAYLLERFFNVWIDYQVGEKGIKVLHRKGIKIIADFTIKQKIIRNLLFLIPSSKMRKRFRHKYQLQY